MVGKRGDEGSSMVPLDPWNMRTFVSASSWAETNPSQGEKVNRSLVLVARGEDLDTIKTHLCQSTLSN